MARKPTKASLKPKLDKIVGEYARSRGYCEAGGKFTHCTPGFQWCHIKTRRYISTRWEEDNYLCLCPNHHFFFHEQPDVFGPWLDATFGPERSKRLEELLRNHPKDTLQWRQEKLKYYTEKVASAGRN